MFLMIRAVWERPGIVLFHSSFFRSAEVVGNFRPRLPKTLNRFFVFFARHNPNKFGAVFAYRERRYFIISIWTFTDSSWIAFMISEMNSGSRSSDCPIAAFVQDFIVTLVLQDGHVVLLLVGADLLRDVHPLGEEAQQLLIDLVDLAAQDADVLRGLGIVAHHEQLQRVVQHFGRHLLRRIAQRTVGIAVGFDDKSVEVQVERLLRDGSYQFAFAADVARVAEDGEVGVSAAKFDRNMPERSVAVDFFS